MSAQVARETRRQEEAEEYRTRMEKASQRAAAPTFKAKGKVQMIRSVLPRTVAKKLVDTAAVQAMEELQIYIDKSFP